MIKILDVIQHNHAYGTQTFVVIDKKPNLKYKRIESSLIGEDSGFFGFYIYRQPSKSFQAFGGRKFSIPLIGGGSIEAEGQWWDGMPDSYHGLVSQLGVATPEQLNKCHVFCAMYVDNALIDEWLATNEPSNNYNKYNPKDKSYGEHLIQSKFEGVHDD